MRAAMSAAEVGDDVFGDDPSVNALQDAHRRDARHRSRAVLALRHPVQPRAPHGALPARRRVHRRASWRTPTATRPAAPRCSAACSRSRWTTSPTARWTSEGHRGRHQARRCAFRAHPAAGAGEHEAGMLLSLRGGGPWPGASAAGLATHLDGARLFNAAVKPRSRPVRAMPAASTAFPPCLSKGLGAPVGSRAAPDRASSSPCAPHPQDARRRHAPGRHAGRSRPLRARAPRRRAWPRTMPMPRRSHRASPACR